MSMKKFMKFIGYGFLILLGLIVIGKICGKISDGDRVGTPKISEKEYLTSTESGPLDYRKGTLGQYAKGKLLIFKGKIDQIIGDKGAMISTKPDEQFDYAGNQALLAFDSKPQLLENDVVLIKGMYIGPKKYTTVMGAKREVPLIQVDYYKIWQK